MFQFPEKLLTRYRAWPPLSLAGRVACCAAVLMLLLIGIAWGLYAWDVRLVTWGNYVTPLRVTLLIALLLATCATIYCGLRLWLQAPLPSSDRVHHEFATGLKVLREKGINLDSLPLQLLLGGESPNQSRAMVHSLGFPLRIDHSSGREPHLGWIASSQAITLSIFEAGAFGLLLTKLRGIAAVDDEGELLRTLRDVGLETATEAKRSPLDPEHRRPPMLMRESELSTTAERLRTLCRLVQATRRPLCAVNHVIVRVPLDVLLRHSDRGAELARALRQDVEIIQEVFDLHVAITVVIDEGQHHAGLLELSRRLGEAVVDRHPLGCRSDVESEANTDHLAAVANLCCGDIEDRIYSLFRHPRSLSHTGNPKLYRLLADVRTHLRPVLTEVLTGGLAFDARTESPLREVPIAGCFIIASDTAAPRRAFSRAVGTHLDDHQERLSWTRSRLRSDRVYRTTGRVVTVAALLLMLTGLGFAGRHWRVIASPTPTPSASGTIHVQR